MSRMSVANPRSTTPVNRTARPMSRPIRVDLGPPAQSGGPIDPLATRVPWGVEPAPMPTSDFGAGGETHVPLSDLVDTAGAQLGTLRRLLDEAAQADRVVRGHVNDLMQRLQQGQRFALEFDQRLLNAGKAAGVLDKAAATLRGLEELVEQIRGAQGAMEQRLNQKFAEHETHVQSRLDEMTLRYEEMMQRVDSAAEHASLQASEKLDQTHREIRADMDKITAQIDRHSAQTQARVSLILDSAADRLTMMDQQAQGLGGRVSQEVDALCDKAVKLLGFDPRKGEGLGESAQGSLADAVKRAQEMIEHVDESAVRITAIRSTAEDTIARLDDIRAQIEAVSVEGAAKREAMQESIASAMQQAARAEAALQVAVAAQSDAASKSDLTTKMLLRQREDLQAIAEASRYHVEQAKAADESLKKDIDTASARGASLRRAVDEVSDQAANLVGLTKDVATWITRAEEAKKGLGKKPKANGEAAE